MAETAAATAHTWDAIYRAFEKYPGCDDGSVSEGYSETITVLLSRHWGTVRGLQTRLNLTPAFRPFVVRHIDETVPADRLKHIAQNAENKCPSGAERFCREVESAAKGKAPSFKTGH
jgi:hypothetical protein